jgi:eukaryotic-like serine/threonine-protein kinase
VAKKLKVGDTIRGYRVTKVFGPGAMAISYAAQAPGGPRIFLKQYKSPAPTVIWYPAFVDYQQELAARVRGGKAAHYAVRLVDAFEEVWGGPCYFQAYEFVEHGADLQQILDEERETHRRTGASPLRDAETWARHVTWAKVLMAGIAALHESKIAHADLKPPNVYLIRDASIGSGYQLKLIDMDFSVLADHRAPWHGYQGYVGSDNYRSPEHLTRGAMPGLASDVFTCGLILHELLAGTHPYWREDQAEYASLVRAYAAKPSKLAGVMPAPATNVEVSTFLHRCLSPDAADRPTAAELRAVLSGRGPRTTARVGTTAATGAPRPAATASSGTSPGPGAGSAASTTAPAGRSRVRAGGAATTSASAGTRPVLASDRVQVVGDGGRSLHIGVRTELGKHLVRQFGSDAEFWDVRQCVLERRSDRRWQIVPLADAANETLLNGERIAAPQVLHEGDVIAVGREAAGIVKLPLTVSGLAG